jgi:hypothetical protein
LAPSFGNCRFVYGLDVVNGVNMSLAGGRAAALSTFFAILAGDERYLSLILSTHLGAVEPLQLDHTFWARLATGSILHFS